MAGDHKMLSMKVIFITLWFVGFDLCPFFFFFVLKNCKTFFNVSFHLLIILCLMTLLLSISLFVGIYIYIYIYICVCVCVCVCGGARRVMVIIEEMESVTRFQVPDVAVWNSHCAYTFWKSIHSCGEATTICLAITLVSFRVNLTLQDPL